MKKDKLGNPLSIGDAVIFIAPNYRMLVKGTILRFTPQLVVIEYINTWNFADGYRQELKQAGEQIVKIESLT